MTKYPNTDEVTKSQLIPMESAHLSVPASIHQSMVSQMSLRKINMHAIFQLRKQPLSAVCKNLKYLSQSWL